VVIDISKEPPTLRIGIVGWGWMGQVHARAYARLRHHYPDAPLQPSLVAVADNATDGRLTAALETFGFQDGHSDWRDLIARDDIDVVSVTGPNFIHHDVAVAAVKAGKHLWVEKPAGRNAAETRAIRDAVRASGVQSAAGFNYRNAPAIDLARQLIIDGRLGPINHVLIRLLADYAAHPEGALTWRFKTGWSGSGVLGDLAAMAWTWAATSSARSASWSATTRSLSPNVPRSAWPRPTSRSGRAQWERLKTRTTSELCCALREALGEFLRPAEHQWASSAGTGSRSTVIEALCLGISGGWASCSSALIRTIRTPRS
jgi:hypothetical protein